MFCHLSDFFDKSRKLNVFRCLLSQVRIAYEKTAISNSNDVASDVVIDKLVKTRNQSM